MPPPRHTGAVPGTRHGRRPCQRMTRRLLNLLTVLSLLAPAAVGGCHGPARSPAQNAAPAAAPPAAAPSTTQELGSVPVVYLPESNGGVLGFFFRPTRLTDDQTAALVEAATLAVPGASPWFVLVWDGDTNMLTGQPVHSVYFVPENTAPRVRKGRYCVVTGRAAAGAAGDKDVYVAPYVQVSERGATFDPELEVPTAAAFPFRLPLNEDKSPAFSDVELVEIADVARAQLRREKLPISRIADRQGRVEVHFRRSESAWLLVYLSRANWTFSYAGSGTLRR